MRRTPDIRSQPTAPNCATAPSASCTLTEIWRYPVKSMGGERVTSVDIGVGSGIAQDRSWAVRDLVSRLIVSAKRDPLILYLCARGHPDVGATIEVPGLPGPVAVAEAGDAVSGWLGRRVQIVQWGAPDAGGAFDFGFPVDPAAHSFGDCGDVLHIVTTATLRSFAALTRPAMTHDEAVRRARPNLVVDAGEAPFAEDAWTGRELSIGDVSLAVTERTSRCRMVERSQPGCAERDTVLQDLRDRRRGCLGAYAVVNGAGVLAPGTVELGG